MRSHWQIIEANPELGLYNSEGVQGGGRSSITIAAGDNKSCMIFQAEKSHADLLA